MSSMLRNQILLLIFGEVLHISNGLLLDKISLPE